MSFSGDGVVVGYAPGVPQPTWLTVTQQGAAGSSSVDFALAVTDTQTTGVRSTTVRFATGHTDGSDIQYADLPVTYTVDEPFKATATASPLAFSGVEKTSQAMQPGAGYALTITGAQSHWHATTAQSWIKLGATSGAGAATVAVSVDGSTLTSGSYNGTVTVSDDVSGGVFNFPVTFVLHAAALVVTPSTLTFSVDSLTPASELTQTVSVSDELGGTQPSEAATWSLASITAPWVQWGPASGSTSPTSIGTVTLSTTELSKLAPGPHSATVVLNYVDADGVSHAANVPVSLQLNASYINYVAPYVGVQNQAGQLIVRGANFSIAGGALTVTVGSTSLGMAVPDSDTQLRVGYPALASGRYPVHIQNAAGFDTQSADLLIVPPSAFTYTAISAPSIRRKIVYDAERQTLYGVNEQGQEIEFYTYTSGAWVTGSPYVLPQLTDLDLLPDGKSLVVLTQSAVDEIALGRTPLAAQAVAGNPTSFCGQFLDHLAVANDGKVMIIANLMGCSGFTPSFLFDALNPGAGLNENPYFVGWLYDGIIAGSADGSKLYAGTNGISPAQPVKTFDALTDTITDGNVSYNLSAVSVSGDASRVILQNTDVYSEALVLTGHLPAGNGGVALASRDSTKAFVYRDDGVGPRIEVYDLTLPLQTGALYQLTRTVNLPDSPDAAAGTYYNITMAQTPDGATVFVSGDSKILVAPVQ